MVIVDKALKARAEAGNPIIVGMVGAGFAGRALATHIVNSVPGMKLLAIANRTLDAAKRVYLEAGIDSLRVARSVADVDECLSTGQAAVTEDPSLVCRAESVEAVIEVTGTVEFAANVVMEAVTHGKHVILVNAEVDSTLGPILKFYADRHGVILSGCDGDQPGAELNLYRFAKSIGMKPLVCGNIKGLYDPYRTPATQAGFARHWGQRPHMVTSFADGTKISFEQSIVANATGMKVAKRGMLGYEFHGHVDEMMSLYDVDQIMQAGGIVDYAVGARPAPGVYIMATHDDPNQRTYLEYYKMGKGPLYCLYRPYHLCHLEVPLSVARAVLFNDAAVAPLAGPVVDVVATAKRDLKAGEILDGIGYYMLYGLCENSAIVQQEGILPMGLAGGCRLKRDIRRDEAITYKDVVLPGGRLCDKLRREQEFRYPPVAD